MTPVKDTGIALGVDIGGSGIKGAPVDTATGELTAERLRIPTPQPSTPQAVIGVLKEIVDHFDLPDGVPIGVTFPALIQKGIVRTAANVDPSWIGYPLADTVAEVTSRPAVVVNDADAAGYAEAVYGAARGVQGLIFVATLGTGIGTALIVDGTLVPNTELGHLEIDGFDAESRAASSAREREDLDWQEWSRRLQRYFETVEALFSPDLIVVGGGVSKHHEKFLPRLDLQAPIIPARLRNEAGIAGAAALAARYHSASSTEDMPVDEEDTARA